MHLVFYCSSVTNTLASYLLQQQSMAAAAAAISAAKGELTGPQPLIAPPHTKSEAASPSPPISSSVVTSGSAPNGVVPNLSNSVKKTFLLR